MSVKNALRFKIGDWIVHYSYGIGEVVDIVEKVLDGQQEIFFKVATADIEYWLPSEKASADHISPIRSKKDFDHALQILAKPPDLMTDPPSKHSRMINDRWLDGSLPARAAFIRDLHGMNAIKKLNYDEKRAYDKAENFFINEWVISNPSLSKISAKKMLTEALLRSLSAKR